MSSDDYVTIVVVVVIYVAVMVLSAIIHVADAVSGLF